MEFIDFHTHIYPEKIAKKATDFLRNYCNQEAGWPGTAENLMIFGKAAGISRFVTLSVAVKAEQVRKINEFAVSQNNEYEDFFSFGSIHAAQKSPVEEVDFIKKSGLYGVKIHAEQQNFAIDDERLFNAYDYLQNLGLPVLFHCGDPVKNLSHPARIRHLVHEFPKLRIVAAHFGGWMRFDEALETLKGDDCKNLFFDMSSSMPYLGAEKTAHFINTYGDDRIFFGSDFPLWSQDEEIENFLALPLSLSAKENIAHKNAEKFLGI